MTDIEIPYTRLDFFQTLIGKGTLVPELFERAVTGQLGTGEVITGNAYTTSEVMQKLASDKGLGHLNIPGYLFVAFRAAENVTPGHQVVLFRGVELRAWEREFIVAEIDWGKFCDLQRTAV